MKKSTLLIAIAILGLLTSSCSKSPISLKGTGTFKYEVISTHNWSGSYTPSAGGVIQVQNKPSGWTYTGTPATKTFVAQILAHPWDGETTTDFILNIYRNDVLVATDTVTSIGGDAQLTYVIH